MIHVKQNHTMVLIAILIVAEVPESIEMCDGLRNTIFVHLFTIIFNRTLEFYVLFDQYKCSSDL